MAQPVILAIDQGTTSTRAIVFDRDGTPRGSDQRELPQIFPASGWVEHDPERIWQDTLAVMKGAIANSGIEASHVAAIGITNQRETSVVWDRASGKPIANAIVWQDRRGAPHVRAHRRRRPCADDRRAHRPDRRFLFLGDQDRLAAR